jgi:hypothetical protein
MSAAKIRALNDAFRSTFEGGRVVVTAGVRALPADTVARVLETTRTFADFNEGNDPHGEHDFGAFELAGCTFFWKIDYYDTAIEYGSDDPADPDVTTRVLTIMLADEY